MKKGITFLLLLFSAKIFSQNPLTKELSIKTDNDLYVSYKKDRYYTNGLILSYRYLKKNHKKNNSKRIYEIQLGQQLYTPQRANVKFISEHDRPFAGYSFIGFGFSNYYKKNSVFNTSIQIGALGKYSFGDKTMKFIHNLYGFDEAKGWKYQIANAFTFNLKVNYIKPINKLSSEKIKTDWISSVNTGFIYNNLSTAVKFRIGFSPLKNNYNSVSYNGSLSHTQNRTNEFFFHLKPSLSYTMYDATIQGSFLNDNSPITYELKPIVFSCELGVVYTTKKMNFGYTLNTYSKKLKSSNVPKIIKYGTVSLSYFF